MQRTEGVPYGAWLVLVSGPGTAGDRADLLDVFDSGGQCWVMSPHGIRLRPLRRRKAAGTLAVSHTPFSAWWKTKPGVHVRGVHHEHHRQPVAQAHGPGGLLVGRQVHVMPRAGLDAFLADRSDEARCRAVEQHGGRLYGLEAAPNEVRRVALDGADALTVSGDLEALLVVGRNYLLDELA